MRIVALANNRLGWQVLTWLSAQDDVQIVGLVLHPEAKRRFGQEIADAARVPSDAVFSGDALRQPAVLKQIAALGADLALSVLFDHILTGDFLGLFPRGVVNLHPALLPYNRGQYPNVWSIIEGTPSGTTLHYIDEGIDTGAIIA
ncbi:MAG TPA: formyltransferase family protein, partial [Polyangia bacterium]|nr:formyltransferase family protein [Polyangia bacterium]